MDFLRASQAMRWYSLVVLSVMAAWRARSFCGGRYTPWLRRLSSFWYSALASASFSSSVLAGATGGGVRSFLTGRYLSASRRAWGGGERLLGGDRTGDLAGDGSAERERERKRSRGGGDCLRGGDRVGDLLGNRSWSRPREWDRSRGGGEMSREPREARDRERSRLGLGEQHWRMGAGDRDGDLDGDGDGAGLSRPSRDGASEAADAILFSLV